MKKETYDKLMELWEHITEEIQYQADKMVEIVQYGIHEDEPREAMMDKIILAGGAISALEELCEHIRSLTKHAEIEE